MWIRWALWWKPVPFQATEGRLPAQGDMLLCRCASRRPPVIRGTDHDGSVFPKRWRHPQC
jgi:hypothetical protein